MKTTFCILLSLFGILFGSFRSDFQIDSSKNDDVYFKAYEHVSKDKEFSDKLKNYYQDLSDCPTLNFSYYSRVKPIKANDFPIYLLSKTSLLSGYENLEDLDQIELEKLFYSIYDFEEFNTTFQNGSEKKPDCKIMLTFSKKVNNYLPIKFEIFDLNVDPRIVYAPRTGLYIIEYDTNDKIIDSEYLLFSH